MRAVRRTSLLVGLLLSASCNLSDPVTQMPTVGADHCDTNADCGDHGTCEDGACLCLEGYEGDNCRMCADGYQALGDICELTPDCASGEVPSMAGGGCVPDLCADDPCTAEGQVPGSCTMTSDTETTCECAEGWSGVSCEIPDSPCTAMPCGAFGTCTPDDAGGFACACDPRFAGDLCDACAPPHANFDEQCLACEVGLYGSDCTLSCDAAAAGAWWNADWGQRRAVIVGNLGSQPSPAGALVSFTFDHSALGVNPGGDDVRIVEVASGGAQQEVARILAADSAWGSADTTLWWPLGRELAPGDASVFYVYFQNFAAGAPPADPAAVLSSAAGWARTADDVLLFSRRARPTTPAGVPRTTVHVRQTDSDSYEAIVTDESDNGTATATITVADTGGTVIFDSGVVGDLQGTVGAPMAQRFTFDSAATSFVVQASISDSNNTRFIFGDEALVRGPGEFVETRTYTREAPVGPDPAVAEACAVTMAP